MPDVRPLWSGNLRLSLVIIPVQMYTAATDNSVALNMLHRPTGERIRNLKVIETDSGFQEVPEDEIVKGYEHEKGRHVLLHPDEIDALKPEAKQFVDLTTFVDEAEIDERYFEKPYYLLPDGEVADDAYAVIRDSLKAAKKVAVGQIIMSGRSHIVAIRPFGKGLLLNTLRYASEVRGLQGWFERIGEIPVSEDAVSMASELISQHAGPFEPEELADPYKQAVRDLIDAKVKHKAPPAGATAEAPEVPKVVNIMDALKRSMRDKVSDGLERRGIKKTSGKSAPAAAARGKAKASRSAPKHSVH